MVVEVKPMDIKKAQPVISTSEKASSKKKVKDFLAEIKAELRRISWTNRTELKTYTKIVVLATFFFGMGIYIIDLLIQLFLNGLHGLIHLIGG